MSEIRLVIAKDRGRLFVDDEEIVCESLNLDVKHKLRRRPAVDHNRPVYEPVGEPVAKLSYVDSNGTEISMFVVGFLREHDQETDEVCYTLTPLPDFTESDWEDWHRVE